MSGRESRDREGADAVQGQHGARHAAFRPFGAPTVPEGKRTSNFTRYSSIILVQLFFVYAFMYL